MKKSLVVLGVVCVMASVSMAEVLTFSWTRVTAFDIKVNGSTVNNAFSANKNVTYFLNAVISEAPLPTGYGLSDVALTFTLPTNIGGIITGSVAWVDPINQGVGGFTKVDPAYIDSNADGRLDQAVQASLGGTNWALGTVPVTFEDYQTDGGSYLQPSQPALIQNLAQIRFNTGPGDVSATEFTADLVVHVVVNDASRHWGGDSTAAHKAAFDSTPDFDITIPLNVVPEPATLAMLAIGAVGALLRRKK